MVEVDPVLDQLQDEEETTITLRHSLGVRTRPEFHRRGWGCRAPWARPWSSQGLSFPTHKNDLYLFLLRTPFS